MSRQPSKKNYLYARLSKEDAKLGDSYSIVNQRKILTKYAEENGFQNFEFIYDDGYSGGDWERPAFKKMIDEVEQGLVSTIIVKDLSRFGRGYLQSGIYQEILFPKMDVRLISVHENLDSDEGENDFVPMINLFNEWFLKSTSQKIRAVKQAKGNAGERLAVIPIYGYRKVEEGSTRLEIDDESAEVVQRIFKMFIAGTPMAQIAQQLMSERLLNPSAYKYDKGIMTKQRPMKDPYYWNSTTIQKILDAEEYTGVTINFKTWSKSYKDPKCRWNPPENRMVFKDTHPAIVDEGTWEIVRKRRQTKRRKTRYGQVGLFTGVLYCADCGEKLYYRTREIWNKAKTEVRYEGLYSCSSYRKATQYRQPRLCTCHYAREKELSEVVVVAIRIAMEYVNFDAEAFAQKMLEKSQADQVQEIAKNKRLIVQKRQRIEELDKLFERLYEDHVVGKLTAERFGQMSAKFEDDQKTLRDEVEKLKNAIFDSESYMGDVGRFIELAKQYTEITELTPALVSALIDKIIVHEPDKKRGKDRNQQIDIVFNFVGPIDTSEIHIDGVVNEVFFCESNNVNTCEKIAS